ncbi:YuzB family protein [Thermoflavimicrobium dichotomicum]|uniref:Uncharacterized protein YuzB, UPF0349 family n=1 Tax=Thermoflavimicrobium dichotomicum TaxID=46223 RepID=A0A1I3LQ42_9BACL|nr:YuzB family protein [Thermoflavimicrobium dichotomicum]SFI86625.1 Uncharacterized protein YuzB, UPF0349 family [Thermoflavimicrobium dichotomicum]
MRPLIEFCINNLTDDMLKIKKKLDEDYSVDVIEYGCLGYCGNCATHPYALVNGELVQADTAEELLEKIYKAIEEMEISF